MNTPDYVPKQHVDTWSHLNNMYGGGRTGLIAANTWLKDELTKPVQVRQSVKFELVKGPEFIKRSEDGEEYLTYVLATDEPHKDGKRYSKEALMALAEQISKNGIVADIDHELFDKLQYSNYTVDQIKSILQGKPGIAKAVKAIYDQGKLYIRTIIDKRYRNVIEKAKGVSLEALMDTDGDVWTGGDILGFTFNVNTEPAQYGVGRVA